MSTLHTITLRGIARQSTRHQIQVARARAVVSKSSLAPSSLRGDPAKKQQSMMLAMGCGSTVVAGAAGAAYRYGIIEKIKDGSLLDQLKKEKTPQVDPVERMIIKERAEYFSCV